MTVTVGKAEIAALIPHAGAMCLLDAVVRWDNASIVCRASIGDLNDHPLAADGRLDCVCGIEYAAQAMAMHGGLTAGRRPGLGYLASVRDVICHVGQLEPGDLEITAALLFTGAAGAMYRFELRRNEAMILEGRAAVVIDAGQQTASNTVTT